MVMENGFSLLQKKTAVLGKTDASKRLQLLFDEGTYCELDRFAGEDGCGVVTAYGYVNGSGVYAFSQDITVNNGAMGRAQSARIENIYDLALKNGCPVVGIYDSKGAFADEGIDALNAYGSLIALSGKLSGVVPQISVIAGKCLGSAAVLASLADVVIMNKTGELCVDSPAIIGDETVGSSELAYKNGTAAVISESDGDAVNKAREILSFLPANNLSVPAVTDYVPAAPGGEGVSAFINSVVDAESFTEVYGGFAKCAVVGFARIGGNAVGIVATDESKNDGKLCGKGAAKISRFVRLCDAFSLPVVTLLDSKGVMGNKDDEFDGSVKAVASLTAAYAEATTVKVTVINGKAYGTAYTAMAGKASGADYVLATADSVISALEPMTAVQFLYSDRLGTEKREDLEKEYSLSVASPFTAAVNGAVNDVISVDEIAEKVISALDMLASKRVSTMEKKHSDMPF